MEADRYSTAAFPDVSQARQDPTRRTTLQN
jgi:hypothetical protein